MIKDFNDLYMIEGIQSDIENLICDLYLLAKETKNEKLKVKAMKIVRSLRRTEFGNENKFDIEIDFE